MKIAFICGPLDYGGAGKIIKFVANGLVEAGIDVSIFSLWQKERPVSLSQTISFESRNYEKKSRLPWRFSEIRDIREFIIKTKADIVCPFVSDIVFLTKIATLGLKNFALVPAERGDPYTLPGKWKPLVRWAYTGSDYGIFQLKKQGEFFGEELMKRSYVIPNPFVPSCDINNADINRNKTIVTAGRFDYQKGFDVLIKAFAIVTKIHPEYKLIINGSGPLKDDYVALSKELGIDGLIEYPGYVNDVAYSVKDEGIFVLPSRFEGIPNALIEAMSTGIPTISADCTPGGPDFLTSSGKRGLLVKVDDVKGTAAAINYFIENPDVARQYGCRGQEIVSELEPSKILDLWIITFKDIYKRYNSK